MMPLDPNDNYDMNNGHMLPPLIRKVHEVKLRSVVIKNRWCRVFLKALNISEGLFNNGTGENVIIRELVETVMSVVGFKGEIVFDASKPDGTPRKLLNINRLRESGWHAQTFLHGRITKTYVDFLAKAAE